MEPTLHIVADMKSASVSGGTVLGDRVWIILWPLLVRVTVEWVDYIWEKRNPAGVLEYSVDELIGHDIQDFEMFDTFEDAMKEYRNWQEQGRQEPDAWSLGEERLDSAKFILSTHLRGEDYGDRNLISQDDARKLIDRCCGQDKIRGRDWFNWQDLKTRLVEENYEPGKSS